MNSNFLKKGLAFLCAASTVLSLMPMTEAVYAYEVEYGHEITEVSTTQIPSDLALEDDVIDSGSCGENVTYVLRKDHVLTISGTGEMTSYPWEPSKDFIYEVVIEEGVTSICSLAFYHFTGLKNVVLPSTLTKIETCAFTGCIRLKEISLLNIVKIGYRAFEDCDSLQKIILPNSVRVIEDYAFQKCDNLTEVTIPDSVEFIYVSAFKECKRLRTVNISEELLSKIGVSNIFYATPFKVIERKEKAAGVTDGVFWSLEDGVLTLEKDGPINEFQHDEYLKVCGLRWVIKEGATSLLLCPEGVESITLPSSLTSIYPQTGTIYYVPCTSAGKIKTSDSEESFCEKYSDLIEYNHGSSTPCSDEPTCTKKGSTSCLKCNDCGALYGGNEDIPATGHRNVIEVEETESTCSVPGHTAGTMCTDCGMMITGSELPLDEDNHNLIVVPYEYTWHSHECKDCGIHVLSEYAEVIPEVAPTCTEDGRSSIFICPLLNCAYAGGSVYPATGHDYDSYSSNGDGTHSPSCSRCGDKKTDEVYPCHGEFFENSTIFRCEVCSASVDVGEHRYDEGEELLEASCSSKGLKLQTCLDCGKTRFVQTDKKEHCFGEWEEIIPASCTSRGYSTRECEECGKIEQRIGETTSHHFETTTVPATEYLSGYSESRCTACGQLESWTPIYSPDKVVLSYTSTAYTGAALTPIVTIKDRRGVSISPEYYTVMYSNNTNVGTATATITFKGNYMGEMTADYTIKKANQTVSASVAAESISVGKTTTVTGSGIGAISYSSSDTTIATVSSTGIVTAKKVGTVTITVKAAGDANRNAGTKTLTIKVTPAATSSLTLTNDATGVKLTWKAVTGATGYYIYRGTTKIATISSGSTVTYIDTAAKTNGTKYTYKVTSFAATGTGLTSTAKTIYYISKPTISSATNSAAGKATVKWAKNSTATGYELKYVTGTTTKTVQITGAATISKVISSLQKGSTYKFSLRTYKTVSGVNYYSAWSSAVSLKITK